MTADTPTHPASCAAECHAADTAPSITLRLGDCMEVMKSLPDCSIDSCVTDPPYGLNFMGKDFDNPKAMSEESGSDMEKFQKYLTPIFKEMLRVAKPGAHLLAFGGTRTFHRLACAIEDVGWEIRDTIMYCFGSGFPKGMDVGKAIDKLKGAEREVVGTKMGLPGCSLAPSKGESIYKGGFAEGGVPEKECAITAPATPEAEMWDGWNSVLKPAYEPIIMARKPLEGTIAENVLKWGTGAINIDGCRVPTEDNLNGGAYSPPRDEKRTDGYRFQAGGGGAYRQPTGRYPANLIHDGSDDVLALFPNTGKSTGGRTIRRSGGGNVGSGKKSEAYWTNDDPGFGDSGSAARFFYCAKASRKERGEGNFHPTVKPLSLMRYLVRLVTRKGGLVLDPFMGSGTTGIAAKLEGMRFFGCEKEPAYFEIAKRRVEGASGEVEGESELEKTDSPVQSDSPQAETSNTTARQMEFEL